MQKKLFTPQSQALRSALLASLIFFSLSALYIHLTGQWGLKHFETVEEFQRFEVQKGITFVGFGALLLFSLLYYFLRSIEKAGQKVQEGQEMLLNSQRQAMTGLLMASVAHDYNNVLQSMTFASERLRAYLEKSGANIRSVQSSGLEEMRAEEPLTLDLKRLLKGMDTLNQLGQKMRQVGEANAFGERTQLDLVKAVREDLDLLQPQLKNRGISLQLQSSLASDRSNLEAYPLLVHQILINLVLNASEAVSEGGGQIEVHIQEDDSDLFLEVHDNGPGIPAEEREQLFSPFTSSKGLGRGLGLLSVKMCVEAHEGRIMVEPSPLGGACFKVQLPKRNGQIYES